MLNDVVFHHGKRISNITSGKSISIFLMSFIYPSNTGYLKRMDLLVTWANLRFKTVNLIIPFSIYNELPENVLNSHLLNCDNLFLINNSEPKKKITKIKSLLYKVLMGLYPPFHTDMVLSKTIIRGFKNVIHHNQTDYFLNTRNNFAGLIKFVPENILSIFDTQDIFTEMYKKYSLLDKNKRVHTLLSGYREKGDFFRAEYNALIKYNHIIAISDLDYSKYKQIPLLKEKVTKIDGIGFNPALEPVAGLENKKYDLLVVASRFVATERGIDWLLNEVAPQFKIPLSLCVVGSIADYMVDKKWSKSLLTVTVAGIVDSLVPYYENSKVVAICMLEGTGTSVKGLEALSFGAAIVSSNAGVRFGGLESGIHAIICDDPKDFAKKVEVLINNFELRKEIGINALEFAKINFSPNSIYQNLDKVFKISGVQN